MSNGQNSKPGINYQAQVVQANLRSPKVSRRNQGNSVTINQTENSVARNRELSSYAAKDKAAP